MLPAAPVIRMRFMVSLSAVTPAPSSAEADGYCDENNADGDHDNASCPRSDAGVTPESVTAKEQHDHRDRIGCAQRHPGIRNYHEWNGDRQGRQEYEQENSQGSESVGFRHLGPRG